MSKIQRIIKILSIIINSIIIFNNLKEYKIIVSVFAGRKKNLEILMIYLKYLLFHKKISEIHLWQFTNNEQDVQYLNSISNIHKTNGYFMDFIQIYPAIKNNSFYINIKLKINGACILINDKYEIIFNIENKNDINISLNINNTIISNKQANIYNQKYYLKYIVIISGNQLILKGEKKLKMKYDIQENNFNSIKIKSLTKGETFWDYKESINKDIKLFDTIKRSKTIYWYEMYKFYLDYDYNLLIKADDDISFIDIDRFDEYINFIKKFKKNVTLPNLVNHAVSLFYSNKEGLIPNNILKKKYQNKLYSNEIYSYYKDGEQGKIIHKYFLDNIDKFIHNNMKPVKLNGEKPSISFIGITKNAFVKIYSPKAIWPYSNEPNNYLFGQDEPYTYKLLNNYLYPRFVCVHYAFGDQRNTGLDDSLLNDYKNIANKYILNISIN